MVYKMNNDVENDSDKMMTTIKSIGVLAFMVCLFIFSWNIAFEIIGFPHGAEYVLCFILTMIIFSVIVTLLTFIVRAMKGD